MDTIDVHVLDDYCNYFNLYLDELKKVNFLEYDRITLSTKKYIQNNKNKNDFNQLLFLEIAGKISEIARTLNLNFINWIGTTTEQFDANIFLSRYLHFNVLDNIEMAQGQKTYSFKFTYGELIFERKLRNISKDNIDSLTVYNFPPNYKGTVTVRTLIENGTLTSPLTPEQTFCDFSMDGVKCINIGWIEFKIAPNPNSKLVEGHQQDRIIIELDILNKK